MLNENGENGQPVDALTVASPARQLVVAVAGPLMNLLIAVVLYMAVFAHQGVPQMDRVAVVGVAPHSPAAQAGLQPGDIIVAVNGVPMAAPNALHDAIYAHLGEPIRLTVARGAQQLTVTLTPRNPPPPDGAIGISMAYPLRRASLLATVGWSIKATADDVVQVAEYPLVLLRRNHPANARLLGYKGMYEMYRQFRAADVQAARKTPQDAFPVNTLVFFIIVTVSLGVFNLLPLPALDGGRMVLALAELLARRRVPVAVVNAINFAGFVALLGLLLLVNLREWLP
jgi:regulator of sigma E protease